MVIFIIGADKPGQYLHKQTAALLPHKRTVHCNSENIFSWSYLIIVRVYLFRVHVACMCFIFKFFSSFVSVRGLGNFVCCVDTDWFSSCCSWCTVKLSALSSFLVQEPFWTVDLWQYKVFMFQWLYSCLLESLFWRFLYIAVTWGSIWCTCCFIRMLLLLILLSLCNIIFCGCNIGVFTWSVLNEMVSLAWFSL
jgi:hypothetical protein